MKPQFRVAEIAPFVLGSALGLDQVIRDASTDDEAVAWLENMAHSRPDLLAILCRYYVRSVRNHGSRQVRNAHKRLTGAQISAEAVRKADRFYGRQSDKAVKAVSDALDTAKAAVATAQTIFDTWLYKGTPLGDLTREDLIVAADDLLGVSEGARKVSEFYRRLSKKVASGKRVRETISIRQVLTVKRGIWS